MLYSHLTARKYDDITSHILPKGWHHIANTQVNIMLEHPPGLESPGISPATLLKDPVFPEARGNMPREGGRSQAQPYVVSHHLGETDDRATSHTMCECSAGIERAMPAVVGWRLKVQPVAGRAMSTYTYVHMYIYIYLCRQVELHAGSALGCSEDPHLDR